MGILEGEDSRIADIGLLMAGAKKTEVRGGRRCFHVKVSDRDQLSAMGSFVTMMLALTAGLVAIGVIFFLCGVNPLFAFKKKYSAVLSAACMDSRKRLPRPSL